MTDFLTIIEKVLFELGIGSVVIIGLSSWLGKIWATRTINKEIEELRNEHKLSQTEHSVTFSSIYAKQFKVVSEIYGHLCETENSAKYLSCINVPSINEDIKKDALGAFQKSLNVLQEKFVKSRLYLPQQACDKMDAFLINMRNVVDYQALSINGGFGFAPKEHQELIVKISDIVNKNAPEIRTSLEHDFRNYLKI